MCWMASGSKLSVWRLSDSQLSRHSKRGRGWKRVEQTRLPLELNGYNATRFLKAPPFQCLKVCVCVFLLVQDSRAWTACCSAGLWKRGVATKSGQQPRSLAFKSWTTEVRYLQHWNAMSDSVANVSVNCSFGSHVWQARAAFYNILYII